MVKVFVFTDFLLLSGWGLMSPIFSIFVKDNIRGATLITIGIAAGIYWLTKSLMQLPFANFLDRTNNERVNFYFSVIGLLLASVTAFSFVLINEIWQLYLVHFLQAVAFGLYVPSWSGLFSKHLDKDHMSLDWSLDSTAVGVASGLAGFVGGALADWFGFPIVFELAAVFSLGAAAVMMFAPQVVFPKRASVPTTIKDHTPVV
jgi:MFS family permease